MNNTYTGIGSRATPKEIISVMEDAGYRLARMGWVLRSGKAAGADAAFQTGVQRYRDDGGNAQAEIYIPWKKFTTPGLNDDWDMNLDYIDFMFPENKAKRDKIVSEIHPYAENLSQGAFKLHSRNVHQVLGPDLHKQKPSSFLLYYAEEDAKGNPKGGTATAVKLAKDYGVRCLNLKSEESQQKLENFLNGMEVRRGYRT